MRRDRREMPPEFTRTYTCETMRVSRLVRQLFGRRLGRWIDYRNESRRRTLRDRFAIPETFVRPPIAESNPHFFRTSLPTTSTCERSGAVDSQRRLIPDYRAASRRGLARYVTVRRSETRICP